MKSLTLTTLLVVTASALSSCAGMRESLHAQREKVVARQEAQREAQGLAGADQATSGTSAQAPAPAPSTNKRHAPYAGTVRVAVFVSFEGELWQKGMKARAEELMRRDLAAHTQFDLIPEQVMNKLGKLARPKMGSAAWASKVRDKLGKKGPQILLHVTLTSEEAIGKNKKTGKIEKYPRFTAQTAYRHTRRDASASYSKDGHIFANGNVTKAVIAEFHERALTEIMPAPK